MATILNESGVVFEYQNKFDEAIRRRSPRWGWTIDERCTIEFIGHACPTIYRSPSTRSIRKSLEFVDDSCREIRSISHQMMPQIWQRKGLELALLEFTQKIRHPELNITLHVEGIDDPLALSLAGVIYSMIQEGVKNAIKHAQAKNLDISVIQEKTNDRSPSKTTA